MDKPSSPKEAEARRVLRRLQQSLRAELRRRGAIECRYAASCLVAKAGRCPGMC